MNIKKIPVMKDKKTKVVCLSKKALKILVGQPNPDGHPKYPT